MLWTRCRPHYQGPRKWHRMLSVSAGLFAMLLTSAAAADTLVVASVLPNSRSVQVGTPATLFATMLNAGAEDGSNCRIGPDPAITGAFSYQTTNPVTNELTGSPDTPVTIAAGGFQTFIVTITPGAATQPTEVALEFVCDNAAAAGPIVGVNTFAFSASNPPVPDVIALGATPSADGVIELPYTTNINAFSVASVNLGAGEELSITAELSDPSINATISLCETDPLTSVCINPTVPTTGAVTAQVNSSATPTFGVFVSTSGIVPFDPATNRVFVRFTDSSGALRGSTSVAVRTQPYVPFMPELVTGTTLWHEPARDDRLAGVVAGHVFNADGTGKSYENTIGFLSGQSFGDISENFTWSIANDLLEVSFNNFTSPEVLGLFGDYSELVTDYGLPQSVADFLQDLWDSGQLGTELRLERTILSRSTRALTSIAGVMGVESTTSKVYTMDEELLALGWTDPLPEGELQKHVEHFTLYTPDALATSPGQSVAAGETWTVPFVYSPQDPTVSDQPATYVVDALDFQANGTTAPGRLSDATFAWNNSNGTLILTDGSEQHRIRALKTLGAQSLALAEYFVNGALTHVSGQLIAKSDASGAALAAELVDVDPIIWKAGLKTWQADRYQANGVVRPEFVLGYQFVDSQLAGRLFGYGAGQHQCAGNTVGCFEKEGTPLWNWSATGDMIVRSRDHAGTLRTRTWEVLSYTDDRAVILESAVWKTGSNDARFVIPPRINTIERFDLNQLPAELANSSGF